MFDYDATLRKARELRAAGLSYDAISKALTEAGYKTARGRPFCIGTVWRLLNGKYGKKRTKR